MSNPKPAPPSFLLGYWRPWSENANAFESYVEYTKDVSLATYNAGVIGQYISHASKDHIQAVGRLTNKLGQMSAQLSGINSKLAFLNRNTEMLLEQQRITNLLLQNIIELLRIPDSEKERQHAIEMGLKFYTNAQHDADLYTDALDYLVKAEAVMKQDYFVLHRIGCIYLHANKHLDPTKSLDYFLRAAKYASVESSPAAQRLVNVLATTSSAANKNTSHSPLAIGTLAAQSYEAAAFCAYVLGRFSDAVDYQRKAAGLNATAENRFLLSKYLVRNAQTDEGLPHLAEAIDESPVLVHAVFQEVDLLHDPAVLDLVESKNEAVDSALRSVQAQCQQHATQLIMSENKSVASALAAECDKLLQAPYEDRVSLKTDLQSRCDALHFAGGLERQLAAVVKSAKMDGTITVEEAWAIRQSAESYLRIRPNSEKIRSLHEQCKKITEPESVCNSVAMQFRRIPQGSVMTGWPEKVMVRRNVATAFYICEHQVTNHQWRYVMGTTPPSGRLVGKENGENINILTRSGYEVTQSTPRIGEDDFRPVENVSWLDAIAFCEKLTELSGEQYAGRTYRLPTELEWEYACRGGTTTEFWFGDAHGQWEQCLWCCYNAQRVQRFKKTVLETVPVGQKAPNPFGLYDVHGNVWEWCSDKGKDQERVVRGGSCAEGLNNCRSAFRHSLNGSVGHNFVGLRLVLSLGPPRK